jgi:hypothetical protein
MNTSAPQPNDDEEVMPTSIGAGESDLNGADSEAWLYENSSSFKALLNVPRNNLRTVKPFHQMNSGANSRVQKTLECLSRNQAFATLTPCRAAYRLKTDLADRSIGIRLEIIFSPARVAGVLARGAPIEAIRPFGHQLLILRGERGISKRLAFAFSERFGVPVAAFLEVK